MKFFDSRPEFIHWNSEAVVIPYLSPADNKVHRYFPDFFIEYVDKNGSTQKEIVEVKPLHESDEAFAKHDRAKESLAVNNAKWKSAAIYCQSRGLRFRVITELSIFYQGAAKAKKTLKKAEKIAYG